MRGSETEADRARYALLENHPQHGSVGLDKGGASVTLSSSTSCPTVIWNIDAQRLVDFDCDLRNRRFSEARLLRSDAVPARNESLNVVVAGFVRDKRELDVTPRLRTLTSASGIAAPVGSQTIP